MTELPERARALFDGKNHVTVATIDPGGAPQTSLVWAKADGGDVVFSTIVGRRKHANLLRDDRISVLVFDAADPYVYAEVRGTASITADPDADLIDELALKYVGETFGERPGEQRVIVRVTPSHVVIYED